MKLSQTHHFKQNAYDVEMLRRKDIERILRELDVHSLEKKKSENLIENYSIIVENLKNNGNKLKQKEVKVENETCSACGQKLPEDKIKETLEKLKQQQLEELQKIKEDYDRQKKELEKAGPPPKVKGDWNRISSNIYTRGKGIHTEYKWVVIKQGIKYGGIVDNFSLARNYVRLAKEGKLQHHILSKRG